MYSKPKPHILISNCVSTDAERGLNRDEHRVSEQAKLAWNWGAIFWLSCVVVFFGGFGFCQQDRQRAGDDRNNAATDSGETVNQAIHSDAEIFFAPDDHTDYLWTAGEKEYRRAFVTMLDFYLDQINRTIDEPDDYHARWNCDGSFWLWEYQQEKTAEEFAQLIERIRDGHVSVPKNALVSTYGAQPAEAVLRGMYYAGRLEREHQLQLPIAIAMENQTLPLGLGALWSGAGVRYSWKGVCGCATRLDYSSLQNRSREVYWWEGLDQSRVLMKWYSLGKNNQSLGGYAEARNIREAVNRVRTDPSFTQRHPQKTIGLFGYGWDDLKTTKLNFPAMAKELTTETSRVRVSNQEDYFRQFEKRYGDILESESLAYGNEWDLYCASMAKQTNDVRRSVHKLTAAEAMSVIVAEQSPEFWSDRFEQRQQAHMNLGLYWEHDWTADRNEKMRKQRAQWQRKLAGQITGYVSNLQKDSVNAIATRVPFSDAATRYVVFNGCGWSRDLVARIEMPDRGDVDATDLESNASLTTSAPIQGFGKIVEVLVENVPAFGYRTIELTPVKRASNSIKRRQDANFYEFKGKRLKVQLSEKGEITSFMDRRTGHEYVGKLGMNSLSFSRRDTPAFLVKQESASAFQTKLKITSKSNLLHESIYTFDYLTDTLHIENRVLENFDRVLSWNFDFNLTDPMVRHEEVGAVLRAKPVNEGGHYATRNARVDWLTLGRFLDIEGEQGGISIANVESPFFLLGNSLSRKLDTENPRIALLAGGQIDGPDLGIRQQGGESEFTWRYALRLRPLVGESERSSAVGGEQPIGSKIAEFNATDTLRWSIGSQTPAIVFEVIPAKNESNSLPFMASAVTGLESAIPEGGVLLTAKPAEQGIQAGKVVRIWNLADQTISVGSDMPRQQLSPISHVESDLPDDWPSLKQPRAIRSQQMKSFLLSPPK